MSVLFVMLPLALLMGACAVVTFVWATRRGQFDDLDTPPVRILHDEPAAADCAAGTGTARLRAAARPAQADTATRT